MKKFNTINRCPEKWIIIILLFVFSYSHVAAQEYQNISSATISFVFVDNGTKGTFSGFSSSSKIDQVNPANSKLQGKVKTETIKTGNFLRDWSLKGSKYFDADTYPTISFKSSSVTATNNGFSVKGDLSIKKTTKSVHIKFVRDGNNLRGTTTVNAADYGISVKKNHDENKVNVTMVFSLK